MIDFIQKLTPALEERIQRNHSLNIDTFIIPSPYIKDEALEKDYEHSYVWEEEGEILGYLLVYSNPERTRFHLYKQVTSPFGRGKGIGSAFIRKLASEVRPNAFLYLFMWEKQQEAMLFFSKKGFEIQDQIVYRGLVFNHMVCRAGDLKDSGDEEMQRLSVAEEIGKTRHDARKTLRLLSDMVDRLSVDNCHKIIEDINRETTALINMLNAYRDAVERNHEVNIKTLILERILPFIELSSVPCEVEFRVKGRVGDAYGPYGEYGRALINLASNALDAIREAGRKGKISIVLEERRKHILLTFADNGIGIEPERLKVGEDGLPLFVGKTTKTRRGDIPFGTPPGAPKEPAQQAQALMREGFGGVASERNEGQGLGTRQIFAVFGKEHIRITSRLGKGTSWNIKLPKKPEKEDALLREFEVRYRQFTELTEPLHRGRSFDRTTLGAFIWRLRKMEVFLWDLILQFSRHHNIREIFRTYLSFHQGFMPREGFRHYVETLRPSYPIFKDWLCDIASRILSDQELVDAHAPFEEYGGILLKSYGQATDRTVIFTLDPSTGRFMATDRKLAEHLDFAPYLKKSKEELLRGEFSGDLKDPKRPILLGVWNINGERDARVKVALAREGARALVRLGLRKEKRLGFYSSTFLKGPLDLNTYLTTTLGELARAADNDLDKFLACSDDEAWIGGATTD